MKDNAIEWLTGDDRVTVTFDQLKYINKIKKLAEKHPEVEIRAENKDGSITAHLPLNFIKISAPKQVSEEFKAKASERLKMARKTTGSIGVDEEDEDSMC